jgi:hypothetical protein
MMKEKPIIFSTPMVQALLNTKPGIWPAEPIDPAKPYKCQTRRIPKNYDDLMSAHDDLYNIGAPAGSEYQSSKEMFMELIPYHAGDVFWVRETWNVHPLTTPIEKNYCSICTACKSIEGDYIYRASFKRDKDGNTLYPCTQWGTPLFMPRKAARLFLEVKSVKVERLVDISENDAKAEGIKRKYEGCQAAKKGLPGPCPQNCPDGCSCLNHKELFLDLWDSINAKRGYGWADNPWVWVYEFMRIK